MARTLRHSASFLQTFHTAKTAAQRTTESGTATPTDRMDADAAALAFIMGHSNAQFAAPTNEGTREIFIRGWRVLTGPGLISEPQAKWIVDIAETREGVTDAMVASLAERLTQGFARSAASAFITKYKDLPRRVVVTASMAEAIAPGASTEEIQASESAFDVPAGRYALRDEEGVIKFYKLDCPTQGKWAGYTFLKAQASDDFYPIRNKAEKARILAEISKDANEASLLYGRELGVCGDCGRTLTSEWRKTGRGPVCSKKY